MNPMFDGPIPGENYTSDTKNYPWHRPPDIADYDEAVEYVVEQISRPQALSAIVTLMEAGANLTSIVSMLNMVNISDGKYPIDLSILIAGPIARFLQIMAKKYDIPVTIGNEDDNELVTLTQLKALSGITADTDLEDMPVTAPQTPFQGPSGGLMGVPPTESIEPAPEDVQGAMLGYGNEEEAAQ